MCLLQSINRWHWRMLVATIHGGLMVGAAWAQSPEDKPSWWLILHHANKRLAFSPETNTTQELPLAKLLRYDDNYIRRFHMQLPPDTPIRGAVSPDGTQLAFIGDVVDGTAQPHPFNGHVVLSNPDGSEPKILSPERQNYRNLDWSPDGQWLAYDEPTDNTQRLVNRVAGGFDYGAETIYRMNLLHADTGDVRVSWGAAANQPTRQSSRRRDA